MIRKIKNMLAAPEQKRQQEINEKYKTLIDSMLIDRGLRSYLMTDLYENYNFTALMGMAKNKPRIIDMNDTPNFIVVDDENERKTDVIRTMIATLAAKNYPENLDIIIIDTNGDYAKFKDLPQVVRYCNGSDGIRALIDDLIFELNSRNALLKHYANRNVERVGLKRMLLVFDNIASITQLGLEEEHVEKMADILTVCHKFGIHAILGSDRYISDVIEDDMLDRYMVRVLFTAKDAEESKHVLHKAGAESISSGEAAMVLRIPRRTTRDDDEPEENFRLKPYHVNDEQIDHIINNWKSIL